MSNRPINNIVDKKRDMYFDKKTFFASSVFFFAALTNSRDFPIQNVPLIYPAFLFFAILIGPHRVLQGFRRTKFLCIILSSYWFYFNILRLVKGHTIILGSFAYLLEPLLIFAAAGAVTIRPGGTKAALWALVSMVTLSTACGVWIYFIGEPVASLRTAIHGSIGGNLLQGEFMRDVDYVIDKAKVLNINAGLSLYIFLFSYQLAVALLITLIALFSTKHSLNKKYLSLWGVFIILFLGFITNAERATVLSVPVGLITFFIIKGVNINKLRVISTFIFCVIFVLVLLKYSSVWIESYTRTEPYTIHERSIHERTISKEKISLRAYMPIVAVETVLFEPLGAVGLAKNYVDVASRKGWVTFDGRIKSPHNHLTNVIMYTGVFGVLLVVLLFRCLWKKIKYVRLSSFDYEEGILASACVTSLVHSMTHNSGFFMLEPGTLIVFGLLWGATFVTKNDRLHKNIQRYQ
jgi:hypothetical protein